MLAELTRTSLPHLGHSGMLVAFQVIALTRLRLDERQPQVVALDSAVRGEMGDMFSEEAWGADEFALDLPGKWRYSRLAVDESGVAGIWIASLRQPGWIHTHRVAVAPGRRREGLAREMFESLLEAAREDGCLMISLGVDSENLVGQAFFSDLGFTRVPGWQIPSLLAPTTFPIRDDHYVLPTGRCRAVFVFHVEGAR